MGHVFFTEIKANGNLGSEKTQFLKNKKPADRFFMQNLKKPGVLLKKPADFFEKICLLFCVSKL